MVIVVLSPRVSPSPLPFETIEREISPSSWAISMTAIEAVASLCEPSSVASYFCQLTS